MVVSILRIHFSIMHLTTISTNNFVWFHQLICDQINCNLQAVSFANDFVLTWSSSCLENPFLRLNVRIGEWKDALSMYRAARCGGWAAIAARSRNMPSVKHCVAAFETRFNRTV
jgi:hypothetical protein